VPGTAIALLRVPRFGAVYEVPIVAGTELADLAHGVGHYYSTAAPGAVGNFAVAGHRVTHGQPFSRLLSLKKGYQVVVETRQAVFTYEMDTAPQDLTVKDTAGWVLDPVPGKPDATATQA
jgi:sortase A